MTIGLEIHAELKTNSKMFCSCKNDPNEENPNINICPVCLAYPGTLPVINKEAVRKVILVGRALGGDIADFTEFDRKNYFYPDIPKGYQISQYKFPLVSNGSLNNVSLTRIHLEEDTAKSTHDAGEYSLVDFNRAGVPLMELVTEPVIHSKEEAVSFAKELQLLLQYLDVSEANMEKGQMRVEVNISVSNKEGEFGTKVEVKNINSFKAVEKSIEYEYKRQTELLEKGEEVKQETRGFNENKQITFSQRSKENSKDYRYFPDPDLPKLFIKQIKDWQKEEAFILPETPQQKRERFLKEYGIKNEDIEVYINNRDLSDLFEKTAEFFIGYKQSIQILSNYITSDLVGMIKLNNHKYNKDNIRPHSISTIVSMFIDSKLSSRGTKDLLKIVFENGGDPAKIAEEKNLIQINDPEFFRKIMEPIVIENKGVVEEYKNGKESALQFLVGQGMKASKGSGNPEMIKNSILSIINGI